MGMATHRARGRPTVSAIVVSWNTADLLDACLVSLRDHAGLTLGEDLEVIVVDNGSTDGSADLVREHWPEVVLVANDVNTGYTHANNQALPLARGEQLLLINADAMLQPGCLPALRRRMEDDPHCAVVGPRLEYGDGSLQRWTAGRFPGLRSGAAYFLFAERFSARAAAASLFLATDTTTPFRPDWVSSACMLVRRRALEQIGGMDEAFFCYMDDVDLCQRLADAGWATWYEPAATATHLMGQATRRRTGRASPMALGNFNAYVRRHHSVAASLALRAVQAAGFLGRAIAYAAMAARDRDVDAWQQACAHGRNLRSCLGRTPDPGPARTPTVAPIETVVPAVPDGPPATTSPRHEGHTEESGDQPRLPQPTARHP